MQHTDACDEPIECILLQEQTDGSNLPVVYRSRTLNDNEQKLGTTYMEYIGAVWAVSVLH